jgi:hypothetical protein
MRSVVVTSSSVITHLCRAVGGEWTAKPDTHTIQQRQQGSSLSSEMDRADAECSHISVSIVHLHHSGPAAAFDEIPPRRSHPVWSSNECTAPRTHEWLLLFYLHRAQSLVLDRASIEVATNHSLSRLNNLQFVRSSICGRNITKLNRHDDHVILYETLQFPIRQRKVHGANRYRTPRNTRAPSLLCPNPHAAVPRIPFCPPLSGINVRRRFDSIPFHQHMPSKLEPTNHRAAALLVSRIRRQRPATRACAR